MPGAARQAFLVKVETPATSHVEDVLDEKGQGYIALLLGLVNALPKAAQQGSSPDDIEALLETPSAALAGAQCHTHVALPVTTLFLCMQQVAQRIYPCDS